MIIWWNRNNNDCINYMATIVELLSHGRKGSEYHKQKRQETSSRKGKTVYQSKCRSSPQLLSLWLRAHPCWMQAQRRQIPQMRACWNILIIKNINSTIIKIYSNISFPRGYKIIKWCNTHENNTKYKCYNHY